MWISLIGFMGSGKTTVAAVLADRTLVPGVDLDDLVEEAVGRSIADIFRDDGEAAFRDAESEALAGFSFEGDGVLACGGGAVERESNRIRLRSMSTVVWLDQPWEILRARLEDDTEGHRPLVDRLGWDGLESLYHRRRCLYADAAHYRLRPEHDDPETLARRIAACRYPTTTGEEESA